MLADGGSPLFFSLMKPASYYELKSYNEEDFFNCKWNFFLFREKLSNRALLRLELLFFFSSCA